MRWNADAVSGTSLNRTKTGLDDVATAPSTTAAAASAARVPGRVRVRFFNTSYLVGRDRRNLLHRDSVPPRVYRRPKPGID